MLTEIYCDKFNEKNIFFNSGLNVVLGDQEASNSIGKSTMLMILDLIFGGKTFFKTNTDTIKELGHHTYYFTFHFDDEDYYFCKDTSEPKLVYKCNKNREKIETLENKEYTNILITLYRLENINMTFREIVSLVSRIWGKDNLDVHKALASYKEQSESKSQNYLLRLFIKHKGLDEISTALSAKEKRKTALKIIQDENIVHKITKKELKNNETQILDVRNELNDIANKLSLHVNNIQEIVNEEILELTGQKDSLLRIKLELNTKLKRINSNLDKNKNISSRELKNLQQYFPTISLKKIDDVEHFHQNITKIIESELTNNKNEITSYLIEITDQIDQIDIKINSKLTKIKTPSSIVNRIYELTKKETKLDEQIQFYHEQAKVTEEVKILKTEHKTKREELLTEIAEIINIKIKKLSQEIFNSDRSPIISFSGMSYKYELADDTGTGTAYSILLLLDLALFELTDLPFIIHDSVLFKNINNNDVSKTISVYNNNTKQSFIAIDEINKYGEETSKLLQDNSFLKLNKNKVLYIKNWSKNATEINQQHE
ncbi:DUF2326 domain-containing protein [Maridesulfovibrio zosterae]|uniref:DUF2326 domain-containing protein n=1 Tax=Maridesulfovibrio zosterae TaxID=82171 RepID=UPI000419A9CC|nr:DUF2326 domain-containing protein [Maridesulfovibrio zosterae]